MKSVYDYENYREFLSDFFEYQKSRRASFSQRGFAKKAGFNSHSFCNYVINGKRNLTEETAKKIIEGLGLEGKKSKYFLTLVKFTQAKTVIEREKYFKELNWLRKDSKFYRINSKHYKYIKNWYCPVVRHIVVNCNWKNDFKYLAQLVEPEITEYEAKTAYETIVEAGLIKEDENGILRVSNENVRYDEVSQALRSKLRKKVLELGIESLTKFSSKERYTSYSTITVSNNSYNKIVDLFEKTKKDAFEIVINDNEPEKVFEMIFQIFPVSKKLPPHSPKEGLK